MQLRGITAAYIVIHKDWSWCWNVNLLSNSNLFKWVDSLTVFHKFSINLPVSNVSSFTPMHNWMTVHFVLYKPRTNMTVYTHNIFYDLYAGWLFLWLVEVVTILLAVLVVLGHVLCPVVLAMHWECLQHPAQSFLQRFVVQLPLIWLGIRLRLKLLQPLLDDELSVALDEGVVKVWLVLWQAVREAERDDTHEMLHFPQHPVDLWDVLVHDRTETLQEKLHSITTQTAANYNNNII